MKILLLWAIKLYQYLSPAIRGFFTSEAGCRFWPSCSEYSYRAVYKHGALRGSLRAIRRVARCNSFGLGGIDDVR